MPLRAIINNEREIISIELSDDQWNDLRRGLKSKKLTLTLPCCDQNGFLRISSRGYKHFVHSGSRTNCDWKPETFEHLKAKIEIIEACKERGWKAIPEFSEDGWRADVLAIKGEHRIAFEVQWSTQTFDDTKFRQNRYKESNVRGCWFFRKLTKTLTNEDGTLFVDRDIPAFLIDYKKEEDYVLAQVGRKQLPLRVLVSDLLKKKYKFCEHINIRAEQKVKVLLFETICWKCNRTQHCYTIGSELLTVCYNIHSTKKNATELYQLDKTPEVFEGVMNALEAKELYQFKIGPIKKRYSLLKEKLIESHGCVYCDSIFDDFPINIEKKQALRKPDQHYSLIVSFTFEERKEKHKHWCFSEENYFCE